jgi:hypothetical protein
MDHLTSVLRAKVSAIWSGKRLVIGGVSHGGTSPLVQIASRRVFKDHSATWAGSEKTAVLLFDGISNPATLEEWTGAQALGSGCAPFHQRFVGRYGDGQPLLHSCANGACYCGAPPHAADWAQDTVVIGSTYPPSPYACDAFTPPTGQVAYRFVSCDGMGAPACAINGGDIIPKDQQTLPSTALMACAGAQVSYVDYPSCGHTQCGGWDCGGADALGWLTSSGF